MSACTLDQVTRILGIDPGSRHCGWAVIEVLNSHPRLVACGLAKPKEPHPLSLPVIEQAVDTACREHAPTEMALESVFFNRNVSSAIKLGEARGVIILAGLRHGITEVSNYTPQKIKKQVTGSGKADKLEVQQHVQRLLELEDPITNEHVADGAAIALCRAAELGLIELA